MNYGILHLKELYALPALWFQNTHTLISIAHDYILTNPGQNEKNKNDMSVCVCVCVFLSLFDKLKLCQHSIALPLSWPSIQNVIGTVHVI